MTLSTPVTDLVPIVPTNADPLKAQAEQLIEMALATLQSKETRRNYAIYLNSYLASGRSLTREGVALYLQGRRDEGATNHTLLGAIAAIRKLASEAQLRGLLTFEELAGIRALKCAKSFRVKSGMWLTLAQVRKLLSLPDRTTYYGKRDAAILSILVGCGLRRRELAAAPWSLYQSREGRMCLVDLEGKGGRTRTVPVPTWATPDVDAWRDTLATEDRPLNTPAYRAIAGNLTFDRTRITGGLSYDGLFDLVELYGNRLGVDLAPHDLRRTLAQMLRKNGAPLEQIQQTLGHSRLETTNIYLGSSLELTKGKASVDQLDLDSGMPPAGAGKPQDQSQGGK